MIPEIKKLKEMSESTMLSKPCRDAIKWALDKLGDSQTAEVSVSKQAKFTDDDYALAAWMDSRAKAITKNEKATNLESWANTIRLMREVDGRSYTEMAKVFDWCNKHHFWYKNILCPEKLRAQWDRVSIESGNTNPLVQFDSKPNKQQQVKLSPSERFRQNLIAQGKSVNF